MYRWWKSGWCPSTVVLRLQILHRNWKIVRGKRFLTLALLLMREVLQIILLVHLFHHSLLLPLVWDRTSRPNPKYTAKVNKLLLTVIYIKSSLSQGSWDSWCAPEPCPLASGSTSRPFCLNLLTLPNPT